MKGLFLLALFLANVSLQAQERTLTIRSNEPLPKGIERSYKSSSTGKIERLKSSIINSLLRDGFLEASFDSCGVADTQSTCFLNIGRK